MLLIPHFDRSELKIHNKIQLTYLFNIIDS